MGAERKIHITHIIQPEDLAQSGIDLHQMEQVARAAIQELFPEKVDGVWVFGGKSGTQSYVALDPQDALEISDDELELISLQMNEQLQVLNTNLTSSMN